MPATPAWPPRSAPRLFVDVPLSSGPLEIGGTQAHYLARVMRVAPGDAVMLCDDRTGEWIGRVTDVGKRTVRVDVIEHTRQRQNAPDIWLCPALIKKDRFDWVLEKATELGVAEIHPLITRRCVVDKLNPERARSVVTEAAEQCARTALPTIHEPTGLHAFLAAFPANRTLFFADELGGTPIAQAISANPGPAALLIGPEGGFDDAERDAISKHLATRKITLGNSILRAETASLAGLAVWLATNHLNEFPLLGDVKLSVNLSP